MMVAVKEPRDNYRQADVALAFARLDALERDQTKLEQRLAEKLDLFGKILCDQNKMLTELVQKVTRAEGGWRAMFVLGGGFATLIGVIFVILKNVQLRP